MPCYHPLQASFSFRKDGKKDVRFSNSLARTFVNGGKPFDSECSQSLPCGRCMGCRLEKSRQWAMRCMHEASLHEDSSFLTLTYSPEKLPVNGSLIKKDFQDFLKRYRDKVGYGRFRYYACGEYGERNDRPHYHACIFGHDFADKKLWKNSGEFKLYISEELESIWQHGFCVVGDLSFDSAAYVARYCTKKVTGPDADTHYRGRVPEFSLQSNKPGIGYGWYDKFKSDCYPSDYLVVNGARCKPPRYYDKKFQEEDPLLFECVKQLRQITASEKEDDNTHRRLLDKEECQEARFNKLIRKFENEVLL